MSKCSLSDNPIIGHIHSPAKRPTDPIIPMIIAVPLTESDGFSLHFGAAAKAGLFEVDSARRTILRAVSIFPPVAEPCGWADWLAAQKVGVVLAGGMGRGAQQRMDAVGIQVVVGVPPATPQAIVQAWLDGNLVPAINACEGGHHGDGAGHGCGKDGHRHETGNDHVCGCSPD